MASKNSIEIVKKILLSAGIVVNGTRSWDILVNNENFYGVVLANPSIGLGESYMAGWWDCQDLTEFFRRILSADLYKISENKFNLKIIIEVLKSKIFNPQSIKRSYQVGLQHYNIGNDFFRDMLGPSLNYSCGYFRNGIKNLQAAQTAKMKLIGDKLKLKPGMKVLDIGCGWGSLMDYLAKNYGVRCYGITVSKEQVSFIKNKLKNPKIKVFLKDYRQFLKNTREKFDRVVSVGMFEHVGSKNYSTFMKSCHQAMKDENSILLLHTIGGSYASKKPDPWINKYIFPNSNLPTSSEIAKAAERIFCLEDWHNFGMYYAKTLSEWRRNFNKHWPKYKDEFPKNFYRMWSYYLQSCEGAFLAKQIHLWQVIFTKNYHDVYQAVR